MGSWRSWRICVLWCVLVLVEISLLSTLTLSHFLDSWNAPSLLWGWLVMLSGRYSRTAPESSLSPRWWRYGNQLSNGWITAVIDKDSRQSQMLLAFPPIKSEELGACWNRRPTVKGGTTASLSETWTVTAEEEQRKSRRKRQRKQREWEDTFQKK